MTALSDQNSFELGDGGREWQRRTWKSRTENVVGEMQQREN